MSICTVTSNENHIYHILFDMNCLLFCHYEKLNGKDVCIEDELPFTIPDSWQWCRLKNIAYTISSKSYQILEKQIKKTGKLPVISQSGSFVEGYTDEIKFIFDNYPVIVFGDHTKNVKFVDFSFVVGADGVKIIKPLKYVDSKFLYYVISDASVKIENRGYGRHFQFIDKYFYAIPPLSEQKRIVAKIEELFSLLDQIQTNLV